MLVSALQVKVGVQAGMMKSGRLQDNIERVHQEDDICNAEVHEIDEVLAWCWGCTQP
jgi:hypothetical protein